MKKAIGLLTIVMMICPLIGKCETFSVWSIVDEDSGIVLSMICEEPCPGDEYITNDNVLYEIIEVREDRAVAHMKGTVQLPSLEWMDSEHAVPVLAAGKRIALYCTHSDESFTPSDGYYTTNERGSIYEIANTLAALLRDKGIDAYAAEALHHPHDAGAYRRSRQTAVQLLKQGIPDCLIDIHRDGIPDPDSYAVTIGGEEASKIRLLVGRGNQNASLNKEFALLLKAVADRIYPGLIKDIYLGKGSFNQDLLPRSILFECGTYTLEKERVLRSMPMMADVLNRALYGGILGSAGQSVSDASNNARSSGGIIIGQPDSQGTDSNGTKGGFSFLGVLLLFGILGIAVLSTGSVKGGTRKAMRNLHEMTGGLIGKKPNDDEKPEHS